VRARTQQQNAPRIGRAAEFLALAWLLRNHDVWATQMPDSSSVDLLVQLTVNTREAIRIQVKSTFQIDGHRTVNLKKTDGSRYTRDDVDYVIAVDQEHLLFWVLPVHLTSQVGRLRLGGKYSGYAHDWSMSAPEFGGWVK
jgi:hypothetical protein